MAGSGKTTVAMHRISYILYNYKERFTSNEFCIVGGNDLLLSYITSGLPELDVPDIKQKRMDALLTHLLKKEWNKKKKLIKPTADAALRSRIDFLLQLELYLLHMRDEMFAEKELKDRELGMIITQSSIDRLVTENPEYSIYKLLVTLDERVRTRLKFLCPEGEKEYLSQKNKQFKDYYKSREVKASIYEIYQNFLISYDAAFPGKIDVPAHAEKSRAGEYDIYDVAALVLIYYRVKQKNKDEEFGQIFIDEAQDFGITPYYVLRKVLPECYFTIMGDVSQNINYETGLNDWEDMRKWMLTGERDSFRLLKKSYRNTIEISEYAGRILEKASSGRYRIEPVIRHGIPVQERKLPDEMAMYKEAQEVITAAKKSGYGSIAVICKDEAEADFAEKWLEDVTVLPVHLTKGLEFDVVLLFNPPAVEDVKDAKTAKLLYVAATRALHELYILRL